MLPTEMRRNATHNNRLSSVTNNKLQYNYGWKLDKEQPFERPAQISTDFKKTSTLGSAVQKIDFRGVWLEVLGSGIPKQYQNICILNIYWYKQIGFLI